MHESGTDNIAGNGYRELKKVFGANLRYGGEGVIHGIYFRMELLIR